MYRDMYTDMQTITEMEVQNTKKEGVQSARGLKLQTAYSQVPVLLLLFHREC
jgi:hypothetical protein